MGCNSVKTQYLTIPGTFAAIVINKSLSLGRNMLLYRNMVVGQSPERGVSLAGFTMVTASGYVLLLTVAKTKKPGVLYFAIYLVATGLYVGPGLNIT